MKKFWKRIVVLVLILFCSYQSLFADYYMYISVKVGTKTVNNPHTEKDSNGNEKYVGINQETGEKECLDLDTDENSPGYQDPNDPNTYSELGYDIPTTEEDEYETISILVQTDGEKPSQQDIVDAINYDIETNPEKYAGKDLPCAEDLAKSGELIEANNAQEADEKYQAKVQEQKSAAETVADPILSTSGQYVFSENDLAITIHGTTFNIGRFYNSSKTTSDNLGKDWYFTLDTRVIRGLRYDIVNEVKQIQERRDNTKRILEETQATKTEIENYFTQQIQYCDDKISDYSSQITQLKATGYEHVTDIANQISLLNKIISKYDERKNNYQATYEKELAAINKVIKSQEDSLAQLNTKLIDTQNKLKHYNINKAYNGNSINTNFDENIECGNDVLKIFDEKGTAYTYKILAEPDYTQETNVYPNGSETENLIPGDYSKVTLNPDGTVTWHRKDNQIWTYGTNGLITRMENLAGIGIDFTYNEDKLDSILFENEVLYQFTYKDNKIVKIQNKKDVNDTITYTYNSKNLLSSITDNEGDTVNYSYNIDNTLNLITKPDGSCVEIKYDALVNGEKWANKSIDEEGNVQEVVYDTLNKITTVIDGFGVVTKYKYNDSHNTTEEHYADGTVRYYEYDEAENVISETYRNDKTTYSYDERGNKTAIKYSDGSTELFSYNSFDLITYYKDRDGVELFYVYDEIGNILSIRKGGSYIFQGQYNKDLLVKSTDGLNVVTEYEYDKYGNVTSIKTGDSIEKHTYDSRNRVVSYVDGEGNTTTYTYTQKTTTEKSSNGLERIYYYNNRKDLVKIEEKDTITKENRITNLLYDKTHNLLEVTNPSILDENGNPIPLEKYTYTENNEVKTATYNDGKDFWQTTYVYDNAGRVSSTITTKNGTGSYYQEDYTYSAATDRELWRMVTTGENRGTVYKYDKWGRVTSVTNALGETSERILSKAGRTLKENSSHGGAYTYTYANGNLIAIGEENKTQVKTEYYDDGSVKSTTDRLGNKTEYFYNTKGELEKTISSENATWYTYDKTGRITGQYVTEPNAQSYQTNQDSYITYSYKNNGRTVISTYGGLYSQTIKLNAFGEVVEVIDGENNTIKYEYDSLGRQIAVYDGYNKATKYEYNALGLVLKVTYRDETTESYEYDNLGNVTKVLDVEGIKAEYTYDTVGRLVSTKERGNPLTEYAYDELDRVTEVKLAGEIVERYEYTSRGRKTTVIDGNENKYQYNYDEYGRLVNETNRLEDSQSYFYDDEGNLETKKDFENKTTTYEYDAKTRTKTTYFADGTQTVYEYSPSGNLLHVTGETGTISYSYNKAGLLVSQVDHGAGETTYYSYNKAGQKTKIESDSRTLVYSYGKNAEVIKVEDYTTKMAVYLTYDVMGRETKRQYKNGVSENTVYDKLGRVILKSETNLYGKVYFAESYVYKDGKRALTVTDKGEVTLYKYNQRGEIESVYYPYSESLEVMAKKEALEAGLYPSYAEFEWYSYSSEEQEQIKEALGRMKIQFKPSQGQRVWSEHYTYDNNSNRLTKTTKYGTINYTYDEENRLRYSGKENLVNLEAEIGGRITFAEDGEIYYAATSDSVAYNATSLKGTRYTYDANGNMLSSESLYSVKFFDYNESNRMKLSTVTDLIEHSYTATTYAYDGFGRRTLTQTQGETATRTLYDGTSFEILRQGTADSNGSFVNVAEAENRYSPYQTRGFGNHYNKHGFDDYFYYLFFGGIWGFGNGAHGSNGGKEEAPEYLSIENMYPIYANGTVSGTYTENLVYSPHQDYWNKWENFWGNDASKYDDYATYKETLYFGTDVLGSVRSTSNIHSMDFGSVSYDIFGSPYQKLGSFLADDSLDFGYLGKPYNANTELYDYGFRDYSPEIARFTTVDPIRDGRNWYCYVVNDPVNYVDLWGLQCKSESDREIYGINYIFQSFNVENEYIKSQSGTFFVNKKSVTSTTYIKFYSSEKEQLEKFMNMNNLETRLIFSINTSEITQELSETFENLNYSAVVATQQVNTSIRYLEPSGSEVQKNGNEEIFAIYIETSNGEFENVKQK
ncbi:MAG: RHS repeat-associated core domain-containing protein [Treponemataceae bacterium]|nr:RHS repeat-associated core domain-containing protein [Treponemataceae bacterium]